MKKRMNSDLIVFFLIIPLILVGAFYLSSKANRSLPDYSVINTTKDGCSVFFKALEKSKYPVERSLKDISSLDINSINIVMSSGNFEIEKSVIKNWISQGGSLVYLTPGNPNKPILGVAPVKKGNIKIYKYNKGLVISGDVTSITNKTLSKKTDEAYTLLKEISSLPNKQIYFNETYLFSKIKEMSLWDYIPMELKFIFYQSLLVLSAFFYYKGKRFGKPIIFSDESERIENEYLYSAASLYRQAKSWDYMLENYYKGFLMQFKSPDNNWLEYWQQEKLPGLSNARKLHAFMENSELKYKAKDYTQIIKIIEELTNIIRKRRDSYWNNLRKPQ